MARRSPTVPIFLRHGEGLWVTPGRGEALDGDPVEAYVDDDLIGAAIIQAGRRGGDLSGLISLGDAPVLSFPARVRVMNVRTGREIGAGVDLPDAAALLFAAGSPGIAASFAGVQDVGPAFTVTPDRLAGYARGFALELEGRDIARAASVPEKDGTAQRVVFACSAPLDGNFAVTETMFGVTVLAGRFDPSTLLAGAMAQLARHDRELSEVRRDNAALQLRLATVLDLGREQLLLERLDLFYLLLAERLDRADGRPAAPVADMPATQRFGPADIDGIGIHDVETDGVSVWRWFGPNATIALRDIPWLARRVVLYFHGFGAAAELPAIKVSTGGASEAARVRALDGRYAVDIPISRGSAIQGGMLVIHIRFDRHQTSEADPRLLSAVFSEAEVVAANI